MIKKVIRYLLIFCITICVCISINTNAYAADIASGFCGAEGDGTNITWTLNSDGLLTISGTGSMKSYASYENPSFRSLSNQIKRIEIQNGVTTIGSYAFFKLEQVEQVHIANSVTRINDLAFNSCSKLKTLVIPDSVTSIGIQCFQHCTSLEDITLSKNLSSLGWALFSYCKNLTQIVIPSNITSLDGSVFDECSSLKEVWFCGNAPQNIEPFAIPSSVSVIYYPAHNLSWTKEIIESYPVRSKWVAEYPSITANISHQSNKISANVTIQRNPYQDFSCQMICATYNNAGKMTSIKYTDILMTNTESEEYSILLSNNNSEVTFIKYFFVDKQSKVIPITRHHSLSTNISFDE